MELHGKTLCEINAGLETLKFLILVLRRLETFGGWCLGKVVCVEIVLDCGMYIGDAGNFVHFPLGPRLLEGVGGE